MQIYDTIMLLVIAATAFLGWRKGMVSQVASIVSLIASFVVAINFYEQAALHVKAAEPWNRVAAFVGLYLATSLVVWIFFKSILSSVERMKLSDFDHQMGGLLGVAKGVALVCVITLVAVNLLTPNTQTAIVQSKSGSVVSRLVHTLGPFMPQRMQPFLAQYVQRLDEALGNPGGPFGTPTDGGYPTTSPYADQGPYGTPNPYGSPYGTNSGGTVGQSPNQGSYLPPTSPPSWPNYPESAGQPNDGFR
jgi:membrane protein required for colicin V production